MKRIPIIGLMIYGFLAASASLSSIPSAQAAGVTASGKPTDTVDGVKFLRMEDGAAVYEVGSGCYQFCSGK
ncbi:MAG: hypothetical protein NTW21_29345 [Verrucomicrobia bacterium]|nr:hypothetical protein [Verrucomicrobiota bacterium]